MTGVRPSTRTYNAILAGHSKFGRSDEISTILAEMAKDEVPKDSYTYSLLVRAYASAADMRKAFGTRHTAHSTPRVGCPSPPTANHVRFSLLSARR